MPVSHGPRFPVDPVWWVFLFWLPHFFNERFGRSGLSGAVGGMLLSKYAGIILEVVGSYTPIFLVAACAYLIALGVVHLIVPRYQSVTPAQAESIQ